MLVTGSVIRPAFSRGHRPRRLQWLLAGISRRTSIFALFCFHNVRLSIFGLLRTGFAWLASMSMIVLVLHLLILFVAWLPPIPITFGSGLATLLPAFRPFFTCRLVRPPAGAKIALI
jgi:hypothetical protein